MIWHIDRYRSAKLGKNQRVHSHEGGEVLFFTEGTGFVRTEEKDYPFAPGMAILLPPGLVHHSVSEKDFSSITVQDVSANLILPASPLILWDNEEGEGRFLAEMLFRNRHVKALFVADLATAYVRYWLQKTEMTGETEAAVNRVYREIIENATDKTVDVGKILNAGGYAEDYIRMLFKKRYGMPPLRFLAKIRMEEACFLMDTYKDIPLSEVAARCGYDDYIYFSKTFKTYTGLSPREYIKKATR